MNRDPIGLLPRPITMGPTTARSRATALIAGVLLVPGLTTACGNESDVAQDPSRQDTMSETPPSQTSPGETGPAETGPAETGPAESSPPTPPTDTFIKVRVRGTITITAGCVDLVDDNDVTWTLLGPEAAGLTDGRRVAVTGLPRPESPDCAGAPLMVQKLTVLS